MLKLWKIVKIRKTYTCPFLFFKKLKKNVRLVKQELTFFWYLKILRFFRRVFSCCLPFPKVLARNICYCGQKPREPDIAHMISIIKYHMPLIRIIYCALFLFEPILLNLFFKNPNNFIQVTVVISLSGIIDCHSCRLTLIATVNTWINRLLKSHLMNDSTLNIVREKNWMIFYFIPFYIPSRVAFKDFFR